jgi:glycosyltransferase involved in cell wall biosynthesis
MKALWVINAPTPQAAAALGVTASGFPSWIEAAHGAVAARRDIRVSVAFPWHGSPRTATAGGSTFVTFPPIEFRQEAEGVHAIEALLRRLDPDIVHIFGTEGGHAHATAQACTRIGVPFVVGLQGLSSTIAQHYTSGLPASVTHGFTVRDLVRRDNVAMQASKYRDRGRTEARTLALTRFVIGRTSWDRAVAEQLNPKARYFAVPETLRSAFYTNEWSHEACRHQSIFVSQGHYPIKGLHFVLRALPAILTQHPDTQLFVSGWPLRSPGLTGVVKQTRYATHLRRLIRTTGLEDRVHFVGVLDEAAMVEQYLSSHVFVSASTVENESNSLSEAKLLGVPAVASYVGGVVDRIEHGTTGFFYQHDAPYMLAHYVGRLFRDQSLCESFSSGGRAASLRLNDPARNAELLRDAYAAILQEARLDARGS